MVTFTNQTLLVIAPHPDDEIIGCGGLISKLKSVGGKVYVLYMTVGTTRDFTNGGSTSYLPERLVEVQRVTAQLGVDGWHVLLAGDQYHLQLDQIPQQKMINAIERGADLSLEVVRPDIIALPSINDYNQDHRAVAYAALTACRPSLSSAKHIPALILSYEAPMSGWSPLPTVMQPNFIVALTPQHLQGKLAGMRAYRSQVRGPGHPRHTGTLEALARLRGALIGAAFAEAYYCHKVAVH